MTLPDSLSSRTWRQAQTHGAGILQSVERMDSFSQRLEGLGIISLEWVEVLRRWATAFGLFGDDFWRWGWSVRVYLRQFAISSAHQQCFTIERPAAFGWLESRLARNISNLTLPEVEMNRFLIIVFRCRSSNRTSIIWRSCLFRCSFWIPARQPIEILQSPPFFSMPSFINYFFLANLKYHCQELFFKKNLLRHVNYTKSILKVSVVFSGSFLW